jgi:hypothetical protein
MSWRSLQLKGTVQSRGEASGLLNSPGDAVIIQRGRPRWLLISCPCGCKEEFPINLDSRAGPAWKLYNGPHTGLSLFPSVWRDSGCGSHYIIWHSQILLCGHDENGLDNEDHSGENNLMRAVLDYLPPKGLVDYVKVAEALDEVPWDVLSACRKLRRDGLAREGKNKRRGLFGRI